MGFYGLKYDFLKTLARSSPTKNAPEGAWNDLVEQVAICLNSNIASLIGLKLKMQLEWLGNIDFSELAKLDGLTAEQVAKLSSLS